MNGSPENWTGSNLAEWVEHQMQLAPDSIAIVDNRSWTFGELHQRMMIYSAGLAARNLEPESTVAVLVKRNADMVALLLAILRCGYAYVPIDPDDPIDRGLNVIKAARCALVLVDETHHGRLRASKAPGQLPTVVHINDLETDGTRKATSACAEGAGRLAYVLFTSGSTGVPKGVEVEHSQLVHILQAAQELFEFSSEDRYLAIATIAFDISVIELFLPLVTGGSLLLRSRADLSQPARLLADLSKHNVNVVQLGPSSWSVILDSGIFLPPFKVVITTGEAVAPDLARRLSRIGERVWNLYGPTETTVWVTGQRLDAASLADGQSSSGISAPIGTPLPRCSAMIVDETDKAVKDGISGELLIGGAGLARGYRDNSTLTEASFFTLEDDGQRYYRTGDLVSRDSDGLIQYHGRIDDQLNIRGVRIEPREVESALLELLEVSGAAATWFDSAAASRGLCCAIVWAPGRELSFEEVQTRLREKVPAAMVPSRFVALEVIPLNANGKVDRKLVREAATAPQQDRLIPRYNPLDLTDTEGRMLAIWAKALGTQNVTLDTHFFADGGDSLSAIAMVLDVEKAFGAKLGPEVVAKAPRLRDFARSVETLRQQPVSLSNRKTVIPLVEDGDGPPLFFSNVDTRLGKSLPWMCGCRLYAIVQWAYGRGFVRAASIQELATLQIKEIRSVQQCGPFRVGGYSMGGLIALEIARQLREQGDEVELLFLLDPMAPVRYRQPSTGEEVRSPGFRRAPFSDRLARLLWNIVRNPVAGFTEAGQKAMMELRRLKLWQRLTYHRLDLYGRFPSRLTRLLVPRNRWPAFWMTAREYAQTYVAEPYDGNCLAVFHEQDQRYDIWQFVLSKETEFAVVDASHLGFFEEPAISTWMEMYTAALTEPKEIQH